MIFQCVAVVVAMICQDTFATTLVIAEALDRARLAGLMDALNDYASRFGTVLTAGAAYTHGLFSWQAQLLLGLTAITSYNTTRRIVPFVHRRLGKCPQDAS